MQTSRATRVAGGLAACLLFWYTGLLQSLLMLPFTVLASVVSIIVPSSEGIEPNSIAGAILNVTKDHYQMARLFDDFLHSPGMDPQVEEQFRSFLIRQRVRGYPRLERAVDWLLQFYWIALPIVAFSILGNLGGHKSEGDATRALPPGTLVEQHTQRPRGERSIHGTSYDMGHEQLDTAAAVNPSRAVRKKAW